jgi:riboflavin synthase
MFTGIVSGIGQITEAAPLGAGADHGRRLTITAPTGYLADVQLGDSIALNGACMTVTGFDATAGWFTVDIGAQLSAAGL